MIKFKSPEIDLENFKLEEFNEKFSQHEHIIVKNSFENKFLNSLKKLSEQYYSILDKNYENQLIPSHEINQYFGSFQSLRKVCQKKQKIVNEFFKLFLNSNLSKLFFHYFKGNFFVAESENCIRRANGKYFLRSTGMHKDGQLSLISSQGVNSKNELTIWTPLNNCIDENTPRLLLLDKNEEIHNVLNNQDYFEDDGIKYASIQLKPFAYTNEKKFQNREKKILQTYKKIFKKSKCFAPYISLGSSIIFSQRIWHGSYILPKMKIERHSMDFRVCGEYIKNSNNKNVEGYNYVHNSNYKGLFDMKPSSYFYHYKNLFNSFF